MSSTFATFQVLRSRDVREAQWLNISHMSTHSETSSSVKSASVSFSME